jgi:DNA adenine methylase
MRLRQALSSRTPAAAPFVKWAGGKTQLLHELDAHVPEQFERYFEPFLGGGAFFFRLASTRRFSAYLSDANPELVNAYRVVKSDVGGLIGILEKHERGYRKDPTPFYYGLRSSRPGGSVGRAARLIALNKTCYNGLYRVNRSGEFNVPMGRYRNPKICDVEQLRSSSDALNYTKAQIIARDYKQALRKAREGDVIYLDPPFHPLNPTASFVDYTRSGFGEKDQAELARVFKDLDRKKCRVLLSNSDTNLTRGLYLGFPQRSVSVNRAISCKGSLRTGYSELLVRNFEK